MRNYVLSAALACVLSMHSSFAMDKPAELEGAKQELESKYALVLSTAQTLGKEDLFRASLEAAKKKLDRANERHEALVAKISQLRENLKDVQTKAPVKFKVFNPMAYDTASPEAFLSALMAHETEFKIVAEAQIDNAAQSQNLIYQLKDNVLVLREELNEIERELAKFQK